MAEVEPTQIQDLTADALRQVLQYVQEAESFAREQAPLVVQEMVRWGAVSALLGCLASVFVVVACAWWIRHAYTRAKSYDAFHEATPFYVISSGLCLMCAIGAAISVFANLEQFAYVTFAPRLYVIERLSELIN